MIEPSSLVSDGLVRVATSQFPVDVALDSHGASSCRFMLMQTATRDGWVAGAWRSNPAGGEPITVAFDQVRTIDTLTPRRIQLTLDTGSILVVTPSLGCGGCNAVLRAYNPFGTGTALASVPVPRP